LQVKKALTKQERSDLERTLKYLERADKSLRKRLGDFGDSKHPRYHTQATLSYIQEVLFSLSETIDIDEQEVC